MQLGISVVVAALAPLGVAGHVQMVYPPTRLGAQELGAGLCSNGGCLWFSQGCQPGCSRCSDRTVGDTCSEPGGTMAPTLPNQYRTFMDVDGQDVSRLHPWRSPGYAPVMDPCGVAGGGETSDPLATDVTAIRGPYGLTFSTGYKQGTLGTTLPVVKVTKWKAGSTATVKWSIVANHGGGYAYRLCPRGSNITEECFQRRHLQFAPSARTTIEWHTWNSTRKEAFTGTVVSKGTWPVGSQWMKNPIPACARRDGGIGEDDRCTAPQFEPPLPGLFGAGVAACVPRVNGLGKECTLADWKYWIDKFGLEIADEVVVPADLPRGDYVLSFRYDGEQTPQIWGTCADIKVV